jgi:hypothetical protein
MMFWGLVVSAGRQLLLFSLGARWLLVGLLQVIRCCRQGTSYCGSFRLSNSKVCLEVRLLPVGWQ